MTVEEDVQLQISADIKAYTKAVAEIPGVTKKEAKKAAIEFVKEIKLGQAKAAMTAQKAAKESAASWSDEFKNVAKGITAGFAAAFGAIAGAAKATAEINEARSEMINLSNATDIALDTLAGIEAAANRAGIPVDQVIGGFEDFGEVLFDFSQGGGRAVEAMELLGFESSDMDAAMKDVDGTLRKVVKQMTAMEAGGKKNAVAQQLFGDAGNRVNAILGDSGLEEYIALAETYGTVIDEEAVAATENWNGALADFKGVLVGATTDLVDFLNLSASLQGFTQVFVFFREIAGGAFRELGENVREFDQALSALIQGDFGAFFGAAVKNVSELGGEMKGVVHDAANATTAFMDQTAALDKAAESGKKNQRQLGKLSAEEDKAAKATKELAKEREKARKADEARFNAQISAQDQLNAIIRASTEDQKSGVELVNLALVDQMVAIGGIEDVLGSSAITQLARDEARARAIREIKLIERDEMIRLDELDAELEVKKAERRAEASGQLLANIALAEEGLNNMASAAQAGIDIRLAGVAAEAGAQRQFIEDTSRLREDATEALHNATTELGRARALERVKDLAAAEEQSEAILALKQRESNRLFAARKATEIATITASGASAVIAALVPPPVGLGPIAGPLLAGTIAAATAGQIATVASQTAPQFDAGFASFSKGPDNYQATLRDGESVLTQAATDRLGGAQAVQDMNQGGGMGGGGTVKVMIGTRELGRAVVDEMGAGRELDQAMQKRTGRRAGVRSVYRIR